MADLNRRVKFGATMVILGAVWLVNACTTGTAKIGSDEPERRVSGESGSSSGY
jgi:hypothetical protein